MGHLKQVYETFLEPGEVTEIRGVGFYAWGPWIGYAKGTVSGYFDNAKDFAEAAQALDNVKSEQDKNIYFLLNPCNPALRARAYNRLKVAKATTSDKDILFYRWLLIDTDPVRPSGISATDEQVRMALQCRDSIVSWLGTEGWKKPIVAQSGNGGHALYRLPDLPNTSETTETIRRTLKFINSKFAQNGVGIDESVYNPARVVKLYGTVARKGDECHGYKHRRSCLETGGHNSDQLGAA